jgi:hypothetical protein
MSADISELRARRHPRAIFFAWAWVALCGLALAWPAALAAGREFRANPESDAPLFKSGSLDLLDFMWRARSGITTEIGHLVVLLPVMIVASVIPLALLLASISGSKMNEGALRSVGKLLAFELTGLAVQALAFWAAVALAAMTAYGLNDSLGEAKSDLAGAGVLAVGIVIVIATSIIRDLASTSAVVRSTGFADSLVSAFRSFGGRTGSIVWGWLWRTTLGWLAILLAGLLASRIGGKSGLLLLFLLIAHQAALAWKIAWRASWLAAIVRVTQQTTTP